MIAALIANDPAPLADAVANAMRKLDGAFSVVALSEGKLIAFRDPRGMRPLCLGRLDGDWVVASETCALDLVGAEFEREVRPGELMVDRRAGRGAPGRAAGQAAARSASSSSSTSRAPTRGWPGVEVHGARVRMGERLAEESPVEADLVMPIPDSGTPAAIGFSRALEHPVQRGADQEPLRRPHVHPAGSGPARAGDQAEVQSARRGRGQARRRRRRLDRPRQHDAPDRPDAVRRRRGGGARPRSRRRR